MTKLFALNPFVKICFVGTKPKTLGVDMNISRTVKQFWVKKIIKLLGIIIYPAYVLKRLNQHFQVTMQFPPVKFCTFLGYWSQNVMPAPLFALNQHLGPNNQVLLTQSSKVVTSSFSTLTVHRDFISVIKDLSLPFASFIGIQRGSWVIAPG